MMPGCTCHLYQAATSLSYCPVCQPYAVRAGLVAERPPVPSTEGVRANRGIRTPQERSSIVGHARGLEQASTAQESEQRFLDRIRALAKVHGFMVFHVHDSRKSEPGFPDLCMVQPGSEGRPGRLLFAELKSARGKLSQEQALWLSMLKRSVPGVEVHVWRVGQDWEQIVATLTQKE